MESSILIQLFTSVAIYGSSLFIPVIAQEFGASPLEIGLLVSIFYFGYFISFYLFGFLADRLCVRRIVQYGLLTATLFFLAQIFAYDINSLFWLRLLAGFSAGIFPAALAVFSYNERQGKMGRFNAYASLGWAIGSILAGLLGNYQLIFGMGFVFFLLSFLSSLSLKDICNDNHPDLLPWKILKKNLHIYVPYFLRSLGAQAIWAIFPLYLISLGGDKLWVGIAYFINTSLQFLMMQSIEKVKNLLLFQWGLVLSVVVFAFFAVPVFWFVVASQVLVALAFSALQVGAYQEVLSANHQKATAAGLLGSIINLTAVVGPAIAGLMMYFFGYLGVIWFGTAAATIGLLTFSKVLK